MKREETKIKSNWKSLSYLAVKFQECSCFVNLAYLFVNRMMIRDALNKQTAVQFRQYAEQQLPGDAAQVDMSAQVNMLAKW